MSDTTGGGGGIDSQALSTILTLLAVCFFCCNGYCFRRTEPEDDPSDDPIGGWIPNPSSPTPSLEERRELIESRLIVRRVLESEDKSVRSASSESNPGTKKQPSWLSSRSLGTYMAAFATRNSTSYRSVKFSEPRRGALRRSQSSPLAPSMPQPKRSSSTPNPTTVYDLENPTIDENPEEEEGVVVTPDEHQDEPETASTCTHRRKTDILVRQLASTLRTKPMDYEQPTTCDICLMDYEAGEEVAWSPNDACVHAFHKDCITDWLLRNPRCPLCRNDYLHDSHEHHGHDMSEA